MNTEIEATKRDILHWMQEMIDDNDGAPYTSSDIEDCGARLGNFVDVVANSDEKSDFEWVKSRVKALVLALNDFNEKHNHTIIETDQREGICQLIRQVIAGAGHRVNEDITE